MTPVRVLIVDDSVVIRKLLAQTLTVDAEIQIVAAASLGRIALEMIPKLHPELVILDIDMPEMDGLETLSAIRESWPHLPVIMFGTQTERGALATIDALTRGASDYVTKPSNVSSVALAIERVREDLIPKIKALVPRGPRPPAAARSVPSSAKAAPRSAIRIPGTEPVTLLAIGASTGGPNALNLILPQLPADLPVPVVVVQHMLASFTQHFVAHLAAQCQLRVVEADHGELLQPGQVYVARGDYHLLVHRRGREGFLTLNQAAPENGCRPAVDVLFESAAKAYGAGVLSVVLTGMGHDGLRGAGLVRQAGGNVIAQDEATSIVASMPGYVADAGFATQVLPIERIAAEIERMIPPGRPPYWLATAR